jgi:hypothetical protein
MSKTGKILKKINLKYFFIPGFPSNFILAKRPLQTVQRICFEHGGPAFAQQQTEFT